MEDLIFRYLDGECTVSEIQEVEERLSSDYEFAQLFSELKQANDLLFSQPIEKAPRGFSNKVMQQILPKAKHLFSDYFIPKILVGVSLVLSLLFGLEYLPKDLIDYNFSLFEHISATTIVYTLLLLLFFLMIEFYLTRRTNSLSKKS